MSKMKNHSLNITAAALTSGTPKRGSFPVSGATPSVGQPAHTVAPDVEANDPASHGVAGLSPPTQYVPGSHGSGVAVELAQKEPGFAEHWARATETKTTKGDAMKMKRKHLQFLL